MGIPKDERDNLGRWAPSGSDTYVRNYRRVACKIQRLVAKTMLEGPNEDDVRDRLQRYLQERLKVNEEHCREALEAYQRAREHWQRQVEAFQATSVEQPLAEAPGNQQDIFPDIDDDGFGPAEIEAAPRAFVPIGTRPCQFVIVFSRSRKYSKLHKVLGGCAWTRQKVRDAQELKEPQPSDYSARCKNCWPELRKKPQTESNEGSDGDSSTSTSESETQ
jgi:hypothetical protein